MTLSEQLTGRLRPAKARRLAAVVAVAAACMGLAPVAAAGAAGSSPRLGKIAGPVEGGARSGRHWQASPPSTLALHDYVEEEFFLEGVASNLGVPAGLPLQSPTNPELGAETEAPYKTRMVVRRPRDPEKSNGVVIVEWENVSAQANLGFAWGGSHRYLMREGYTVVDVSAQKAATDGSPLALTAWDPQRYGSLTHPGDQYSFDIFRQAGQAVRGRVSAGPDPLSGFRRKAVIGFGESQSCQRLVPYINVVQKRFPVFDGFMGIVCNPNGLNNGIAKSIWVNSESEQLLGDAPADAANTRIWEVAGTPHNAHDSTSYLVDSRLVHDESSVGGKPAQPDTYDYERGYQYGELGGLDGVGTCSVGLGNNHYPQRYSWDSGVEHITRWVLDGVAPPTAPRMKVDAAGQIVRDADGNAIGGYRLPVLDVPVATYNGTTCGLFGITIPFGEAKLKGLYPTHADYVGKMQASTDKAVTAGYLLRSDGCLLMERAVKSAIGGADVVSPQIPQCQAAAGPARACGPPTSRTSKGSVALSRTAIRLKGTAAAKGCGIRRVQVAVRRKVGTRCRFVLRTGTLSRPRACRRVLYLNAQGGTKWILSRKARLPVGQYLVWSRATDSAGHVERRAAQRRVRVRVR